MHRNDTAVLLLVYAVSRGTVVSLVVWARMKGAMGVTGVCLCVWGESCYCCWRQGVRALSANSGNLNVVRQRTKRQLLVLQSVLQMQGHTGTVGHITISSSRQWKVTKSNTCTVLEHFHIYILLYTLMSYAVFAALYYLPN